MTLLSCLALTAYGADSASDKAKKAFSDSAEVKKALKELATKGYTDKDEAEAVVVSGGCGFAGCDNNVLVVQRAGTKGANTQTRSVLALVSVPAVGETSLKLITLNDRSPGIELPWTTSSNSTQGVLKSVLYEAMEADKKSKFPNEYIKGNYGKVELADENSKVTCEERKTPGLLQVQEYRCVVSVKK